MMKKIMLSISLFLGLSIQLVAQQYYYSLGKKNLLEEDTLTVVLKISDQKQANLLLKNSPYNSFESIQVIGIKGLLLGRIKPNISRKVAIEEVRKNTNVVYSWHSLKSRNTLIIPTGEILMLLKKGNDLKAILTRLKVLDYINIKNTNKYGVSTLNQTLGTKRTCYA